jgi:type VI secretion system protein VasG
VESGARNVDNILTNTLLPELSRLLLAAMAEGTKPATMRVGVGAGGGFTYQSSNGSVSAPAGAAAAP